MSGNGQIWRTTAFDLLETALVSRASSIQELAALSDLDVDQVGAELELLEGLGYVEMNGQRISYRSPELATAERADDLAGRIGDTLEQQLREVRDLLRVTPRLLSSWLQGAMQHERSRSEVLHNAFAPTDLWRSVAAQRHLRTTDGILPDASRIFAADRRTQAIWYEAIARDDLHVRTILSTRDVTAPGAAEVISADMAVGAEFRMLPAPPSWLWIADDDIVGLPFRWGDAWPTSVFATSDPAVVTLVRWLYERLWEEATPVFADAKSWDPILALMSQGDTLEAASRALGLSARTGRRRIAAALDHFGVEGLLALGVAWERERRVRPAGPR